MVARKPLSAMNGRHLPVENAFRYCLRVRVKGFRPLVQKKRVVLAGLLGKNTETAISLADSNKFAPEWLGLFWATVIEKGQDPRVIFDAANSRVAVHDSQSC